MKPTNEEIIGKYKIEISLLKQRLRVVEDHLKNDKIEDYPNLSIMQFTMMKKGFKQCKLDTENLIHQRHVQIGRLIVNS